jgi:ubiquinone/menaquinone biosynthesis C-methylase UbiE
MFMGADDTNLLKEMARILKPGGKVVILPLYLHTQYCAYSTPEYFGKGYSDLTAREYIRLDCFAESPHHGNMMPRPSRHVF